MTTGRINQVTVRRARPAKRRTAHTGQVLGVQTAPPLRGQGSSPIVARSKSRPTAAARPPGLLSSPGAGPGRGPTREVQCPSPPISQASAAVPRVQQTRVGRLDGDYQQAAAGERKGTPPQLPGCGGSPKDYLQERFGQRQSTHIHHHHPTEARKNGAPQGRCFQATATKNRHKPGLPSSAERVHPVRQAHRPLGHGHTSLPPQPTIQPGPPTDTAPKQQQGTNSKQPPQSGLNARKRTEVNTGKPLSPTEAAGLAFARQPTASKRKAPPQSNRPSAASQPTSPNTQSALVAPHIVGKGTFYRGNSSNPK